MKVIAAIDSFKGSLTSLQAGDAARRGILRAVPDAQVTVCPLADGGEGTVEALTQGLGGRLEYADVTGPLGQPVRCAYGVLDGGLTVIEMSGAAGLPLVPPEQRCPLHTTTYGVGEVIRAAIGRGCRRFIVGIGGSATNDGGAGMLQALGFDLLDGAGQPIPRGAQGLASLVSISARHALPELAGCTFRVACDVTNPLCGPQGASAVYGPQKGATPQQVQQMDQWLARYAVLAQQVSLHADAQHPGAGAAGGLGFAFLSFLGATLEPGAAIVLEETKLAEKLADVDILVTGEGRLDGQSVMGKAPIGAAQLAKKQGKLVLAFSGCAAPDARLCNAHGIDAYFPILRAAVPLSEAMDPENAAANLADTAEQVFRLVEGVRSLS